MDITPIEKLRRGEYCKRVLLCQTEGRVVLPDPEQECEALLRRREVPGDFAACLVCDSFDPVFAGVDPLQISRVMGYKFSAAKCREIVFAVQKRIDQVKQTGQLPEAEVPGAKKRKPGRTSRLKRCSNFLCPDPVLPATLKFFHRYSRSSDGLQSQCKRCNGLAAARQRKMKKMEEGLAESVVEEKKLSITIKIGLA